MRSGFVLASELYDVESRTSIAHPAHQATDEDVRRALENREIRADGGFEQSSSGTDQLTTETIQPQIRLRRYLRSRRSVPRRRIQPVLPSNVLRSDARRRPGCQRDSCDKGGIQLVVWCSYLPQWSDKQKPLAGNLSFHSLQTDTDREGGDSR